VRSVIAVAVLSVGLFAAESAHAQDKLTLNGSWSASGLSESWTTSSWGEACGPKPQSQGAGAGAVQVREQGSELSIVGAGRAFSTAECWDQMPGLSRTSHSASGGGRFWRTRCASAPNDSRRATVVTSISATDTTIALSETGEYSFVINDTTCSASVKRSRSFTLQHREGEVAAPTASASAAPVASAPPPPPKPTAEPKAARCASNDGDAARLEVKPSRKLIRAGDKFVFKAAVLDAEGCPASARPTWSLSGALASKAHVDNKGELSVDGDAGDGSLDLTAQVSGKGVTIHVDVATPEHFDAMLATSGLDASGESAEAAVAVIATGGIGGKTSVADDAAKQRKTTFVVIVLGVAVVLGFVGLALARRSKRRLEEERAAREEEARADAERAEVVTDAVTTEAVVAVPKGDTKPRATTKKKRGKICPTCGDRYDTEATFCGRDATKLVPLN
jgi:hypothetical protein